MTKAVTRSIRSGSVAALCLFTVGLCRTARADVTAFLKINGVDIAMKSVASGNSTILQWKPVIAQPITNKMKGITGLEKIGWNTEFCKEGIKLSLDTMPTRHVLSMGSA